MTKGNARGGAGRDADGLTRYERRFVDEYLIDLNGAAAVKRTGFSGDPKLAKQQAYEMRHRPHVDAAIEAGLLAQHDRAKVTADQVIDEYRKIAFANVQDIITLDEDDNETIDITGLTRDRAAAIAEIETEASRGGRPRKDGKPPIQKVMRTKVKFHSKLHALDKLGVHLKIFSDDQAPSIPVRFVIEGLPVGAAVTVKPGDGT